MKVVVFGATGGTGRALVEQLLERGDIVTAFARDPQKVRIAHPNLKTVKGDVLNFESVEAAVRGQEAVLSALGIRVRAAVLVLSIVLGQLIAGVLHVSGLIGWLVQLGLPGLAVLIVSRKNTTLSSGTKNIVAVMEANGIKRFVCESSLGVGDSHGRLGPLFNFILIPLLLRNVFADKEVQEKIIRDSHLDWVIVRPAMLTNGPRTGAYRSGAASDRSIRGRISRADVADFMLKQLSDGAYLFQTPGISS